MRTVKSPRRATAPLDTPWEGEDVDGEVDAGYEIHRVVCPDCVQPIALLADETALPEHATCPTAWDPFGLTVCQGSGRPVTDAHPSGTDGEAPEQDARLLLTLPAGLDWRTQPFSHAGGVSARPMTRARLTSGA